MARKKPTYRQLIAEDFEFYKDRLDYFSRMYGLSVDKKLQEPKYVESRKRNWESFNKRMWSQLHALRERARVIDEEQDRLAVQHGIEAEAERRVKKGRKGKNKETEWADSDYDYDDFSDFDDSSESEQQGLLSTAFDASRKQIDTGEYEYSSFEETLYQNYMSRLYYYQFVPSVKALINTIEGDEEHFKNIIIRELSAMRDKGAGGDSGGGLPSIEGKGNYEYGDQIASYIQEFLNASTGEQLYDEGYDDGDYY